SKLSSLKSPDEAMKLQAEYARSAYETFVTDSKKISELYTDFAKQTFKPFEGLITKMTPAVTSKKPRERSCGSVKSGRAVRYGPAFVAMSVRYVSGGRSEPFNGRLLRPDTQSVGKLRTRGSGEADEG